jgi:chromosome condensin MukBEF MukE localization factor
MYITESRNILMTSTSLILKHVLLELNMIGGQIVRHLIITVKL